jgi:hypothetical protein
VVPGTVVGLALVLTGCSSDSPEVTPAGRTAQAFAAAESGQAAAACALLAPGTRQELEENESAPCARAVQDADLPSPGKVVDVQVYGLGAMVRLSNDAMFLARFDAGWRVTAAGCSSQGSDRPYSCKIKGA